MNYHIIIRYIMASQIGLLNAAKHMIMSFIILMELPVGVIEKANATLVPPELLKGVVQMIGELPPEERSDFTGRALAVIRFLENERPELKGTADRPLLLVAIQFRLEALSRLHKRSEYKAWSIKAEKRENPDLIQGVLIEAAATEPLIERNEHVAFEPMRFFQTVLRLSEAAGQA